MGATLFAVGERGAEAAAGYNLDQCANGPLATPVQCTGSQWSNQNLNEQHSHWHEGDSVPFRILVTGTDLGSHELDIAFDWLEGGNHAYDYLTTFNRTEGDADPCSAVAGCDSDPDDGSSDAPDDTFPIPQGTTNTANGVTQVAGVISAWNATIDDVEYLPSLTGTQAPSSTAFDHVHFHGHRDHRVRLGRPYRY
jgi:hypothetical protein